ncbi:MAG: hypothetical protein FWE21_00410 [Defluviitaleaceae bacterium]|nr:hypothetical protein [Defluviitaleaceae bacterium]
MGFFIFLIIVAVAGAIISKVVNKQKEDALRNEIVGEWEDDYGNIIKFTHGTYSGGLTDPPHGSYTVLGKGKVSLVPSGASYSTDGPSFMTVCLVQINGSRIALDVMAKSGHRRVVCVRTDNNQ